MADVQWETGLSVDNLEFVTDTDVINLELGTTWDIIDTQIVRVTATRLEDGVKIEVIDVGGTTSGIVYDGHTPVKGVDYYTQADEDEIVSRVIAEYTIPIATENDIGGVKVGSRLSIDDGGVLSADAQSWSEITGKPSNIVTDANYVHTDNNYTDTDKNKLAGIASGAEVNVNADWNANSGDAQILNKPTAVSAFTNDSGYQTAAQVESAINLKIASAYIYKGSVATYNDLPLSGNTAGDVYDVQSTGVNYAWTGTAWDALGSYVDTSLYWAKTELVAMTTTEINDILNPSS